jgi:DHA1 family bicyclomycin/chloramphenicol resistance-like MFS transporter
VIAVFGLAGLVPVLIGLFIIIGSLGCVFPNGTVAVMSRQHANAGVASALTGTLQFSIGAVSGMLVGELSDSSPRAMALCMLAGAACVTFFNRLRPRAVPGA